MPARFIFSDQRSKIAFWNAHASIGLFALLPRSGQFLRRAGFSTRPAAERSRLTADVVQRILRSCVRSSCVVYSRGRNKHFDLPVYQLATLIGWGHAIG